MQTIDVGETYVYVSDWYDEDGDPAEPSEVTLVITRPNGSTVSYVKTDLTTPDSAPDVLDTWERADPVTMEGVWRYTFTGTVEGRDVEQPGIFVAGDPATTPGPCEPWAQWSDVLGLCIDNATRALLVALPASRQEYLLDIATWVLWSLDGRRYPGICTRTRHMCRSCIVCGWGNWCRCGTRDAIDLGSRYPVFGVWDVVIDGVTLSADAYRVRDHRWLDRIDGNSWPTNSDLTDPDAFRWEEAFGRNPPVGLRNAAAVFGYELALRCVESDACRIPERVTQIVREGVAYTIIDPQKFIDEGRTGVYDVDLALAASKAGRSGVAPGGLNPLARR